MTDQALPKLRSVSNFRELGGLASASGACVRRRHVFRSGHWGSASDEDVSALEALGVGVVFDFRTPADIEAEGKDRLPPDIEWVHLPTHDPAVQTDMRTMILKSGPDELERHFGNGRAAEMMERDAAGLVTKRTGIYGSFLTRLAEPALPPVLFHCSAGKDRAGWAASVILLALGVGEKDLVDHYLVSNRTYDPDTHGWSPRPHIGERARKLLLPLIQVRPEYVQASLAAVREHFGGVQGYLHDGLGLSEAQLQRVRTNLLESN